MKLRIIVASILFFISGVILFSWLYRLLSSIDAYPSYMVINIMWGILLLPIPLVLIFLGVVLICYKKKQ